MRAPWLAAIAAAFLVGGGVVLLADPGTSKTVAVSPINSVDHAQHTINGQKISGVKLQDIAAENQPDEPLDRETRGVLADQLMQARATALRFPTVQDALDGGYVLAGGFAPGSGAHYVLISGAALGSGQGLAIETPGSLIYEGTNPDSKIIGLMYLGGGSDAPEGFAGPNDHWHRHSNVCVKFSADGIEVPFPADSDVTAKMCRGEGGNLMKITTWMVHAWVVPGWESPLGVFSHDNPNIRCGDGTYETDKIGFCEGL
jgi:hypothetical protein